MASVTVKVEGLQELGRNLQTFSKEIKEKVLRKAARAAANKVRDAAKANVEARKLVKTGAMRDAIAARRMSKASKNGKEFFAVGVFKISNKTKVGGKFLVASNAYTYANTRLNRRKGRVGKGYEVDPPEFYWKFHELGAPGANIPARPFLVPAFNSEKQDSPNVMATELRKGMDAATKKLAKVKKA